MNNDDFEEFLEGLPDPASDLRDIVQQQTLQIALMEEQLNDMRMRLNTLERAQVPTEEYVRYWRNETYNQCYNWLYDTFFAKEELWFKKTDLKTQWGEMEITSKTQWQFSLGAFVKIGFIEQRGRPKNIEYKWTGLYTRKRELFININQGGYQSGGKPQPVL